jgi:hypothetical protein
MSNSNKKATPKMTASKSATKSAPTKKTATPKKSATTVTKAAPAKKTSVKAVKPAKPAKAVKSTGNKELDKMLATMNEAKKNGQKSVVVFTTNRSHHKASVGENGFGASDLKPKLYEAYQHMLLKHDVTARLVNPNEFQVEWIVKFK